MGPWPIVAAGASSAQAGFVVLAALWLASSAQAGFRALGPLWLPRAFSGFGIVAPRGLSASSWIFGFWAHVGSMGLLLQAGFLVLGEGPVEDSTGKAK